MKQIDISTAKYPNLYVDVDDEDYEELNQYRWGVNYSCGKKPYARRYFIIGEKKVRKSIQNFIMKAGDDERVVCIDGNVLNCQKSNLRLEKRKLAYITNIKDKDFHNEMGIMKDNIVKEFKIKLQTIVNKYSFNELNKGE